MTKILRLFCTLFIKRMLIFCDWKFFLVFLHANLCTISNSFYTISDESFCKIYSFHDCRHHYYDHNSMYYRRGCYRAAQCRSRSCDGRDQPVYGRDVKRRFWKRQGKYSRWQAISPQLHLGAVHEVPHGQRFEEDPAARPAAYLCFHRQRLGRADVQHQQGAGTRFHRRHQRHLHPHVRRFPQGDHRPGDRGDPAVQQDGDRDITFKTLFY